MNAGTSIPDLDHVARHCPGRSVDGTEVSGDAFELRLSGSPQETYLSVNWMERTGEKDINLQLAVIRDAVHRTLRVKDRFARLNVEASKTQVKIYTNIDLSFEHIGSFHDTYSGIYGIPLNDGENMAIGVQLAVVASGNLHPAVAATP